MPGQVASNLTRDEARDRRQLLDVSSYQVELDLTGDAETFIAASTVSVPLRQRGRGHLHRPDRARGAGDRAQRQPGAARRVRRQPDHPHRAARRERAAGGRLSAPTRAPGKACTGSPTRPTAASTCTTDLETFDAHRVYACFDQPDLKAAFELSVTRPGRLAGRLQHGGLMSRRRGLGHGASRWHFPPIAGHVHLHHRRSWPARTTEVQASTTASRWASTAASRWPSTWTRTRSSRSPGRASTSTTRPSASGTRSASTTRCSCRSSRRARWRTPAASRSSRTTCSAPGSPTSPARSAPRRSCTRWRTCGSATWSPCAGGTISG